MSRPLSRPRLAVGAAVAALALLAGCSDDSGSDPDDSSASKSPSEEDFTELSGKEISDISFCYFTEVDIVRHPLVQAIVRAYDRRAAAQAAAAAVAPPKAPVDPVP